VPQRAESESPFAESLWPLICTANCTH